MNSDYIKRSFKSAWITSGVDEDCMKLCEDLAKDMVTAKISSSFLRNIFGELRRIEAGGFEKLKTAFVLLRPKLAYTCGRAIERNQNAKEELNALQEFYKLSAQSVANASGFQNLVSIMEAIIAFHKANGGDNK